jgi:hypothetical protein
LGEALGQLFRADPILEDQLVDPKHDRGDEPGRETCNVGCNGAFRNQITYA